MEDRHRTRLADGLADPSVAWSLGGFGAIAEFMWSSDEVCTGETDLCRVTPRGAIRVEPPAETTWVAYTTPSRHLAQRRSDIALCLPLPRAAMARRQVVTEIGPDREAVRASDRDAVLFDVGLDQVHVDAMVRTADPETLALLRASAGRALFECADLLAALPRLSPHRVFASRVARIEVYGPIPPPDGLSPDGPHTHVLPKLLKHRRTHAANLPIPEGLVPCLTLHPARPDPRHALAGDDNAQDGA